jgi:phosphatidylglycerol---prolipoprotein diacylglyceryl transferase
MELKKFSFSGNLTKVRPLYIAIGLVVLTLLIILISFPWFSKVFSGENQIILNQFVFRIPVERLNILWFEIPFETIGVRWYSLLFFLGIVGGFILSNLLFRQSYLPNTLFDRLFIGLILFGLIGARLVFVLFNLPYYSQNPQKILSINEGGLSIFGGIFAAVGYIFIYVRKFRFNIFEVFDLLAPGLILAQIIGRFGNFFNYEAYGQPTTLLWKMYVPEQAVSSNKYSYGDSLARFFHPTFLYEVVGNLIVLFIMMFLFEKLTKRRAGLVAAIYLMGYGLVRFFTENFRLDALSIPVNWHFGFPSFITNLFTSDKNPLDVLKVFGYWLADIQVTQILVSQVFALGFVIVGYVMYRKRKDVIFSPENQQDVIEE